MAGLTLSTHSCLAPGRVRVCEAEKWSTDAHTTRTPQQVAVHSGLPEQVWCGSGWRIRGRAVSATAAALPPGPARHRAAHSGDPEIRPWPATGALSPSPWWKLPLLLSAMFLHLPSPPSPGSLHLSAPRLLPLDDEGRCDGRDGGVSGHLVMHLLLLDTDTSTTCKEEVKRQGGWEEGAKKENGKE